MRHGNNTKTSGKAAKSSIEASFQIITAQGGNMEVFMRFTQSDLQAYVKNDPERQKHYKLYGNEALLEFAKEMYAEAAGTVSMALMKNEKEITWCDNPHKYITSIKIGDQEYANAASNSKDSGYYITMSTSNILYCIHRGLAHFESLK